jgi:hypothetical protein
MGRTSESGGGEAASGREQAGPGETRRALSFTAGFTPLEALLSLFAAAPGMSRDIKDGPKHDPVVV